MINPFKRKKHPIEQVVDAMKNEYEFVMQDLERQIEEKLRSMPPEEALKAIAILNGSNRKASE